MPLKGVVRAEWAAIIRVQHRDAEKASLRASHRGPIYSYVTGELMLCNIETVTTREMYFTFSIKHKSLFVRLKALISGSTSPFVEKALGYVTSRCDQ